MTLAAPALAQTTARQASRTTQTQHAPAPPPPLFPRHRRGLYKKWIAAGKRDAPNRAIADDPGAGKAYEINLTTDADASKLTKTLDLLDIDANYGMVPSILGHDLPTQLKLEVPISAARNGDDPYSIGLGEGQFGLKFNFYENDHVGIGMAFYPQIEFATAPGAVENGLADRGQTLVIPLLVSKELRYLTLVVNAALNAACRSVDSTPA